ncbi:uncharacterized protein LY79DRAFT_555464 [Colletotrichum navitas]|uniref:Uncharacterized protein n=1 Tax=Colletotrichum navitas TaxID=681940 RepID=A0AAD8PZ51_9PEZI|nr:uncharacterized protein LY79DRAFT_555464 [Colletotrichum navitas]KAK1590229.1 hypothetical protein LY79DRAFT_555464 [Colletotrichum navitas]
MPHSSGGSGTSRIKPNRKRYLTFATWWTHALLPIGIYTPFVDTSITVTASQSHPSQSQTLEPRVSAQRSETSFPIGKRHAACQLITVALSVPVFSLTQWLSLQVHASQPSGIAAGISRNTRLPAVGGVWEGGVRTIVYAVTRQASLAELCRPRRALALRLTSSHLALMVGSGDSTKKFDKKKVGK